MVSKTFDPPLPAANKTDSNKTGSEAETDYLWPGQPPHRIRGPCFEQVNISYDQPDCACSCRQMPTARRIHKIPSRRAPLPSPAMPVNSHCRRKARPGITECRQQSIGVAGCPRRNDGDQPLVWRNAGWCSFTTARFEFHLSHHSRRRKDGTSLTTGESGPSPQPPGAQNPDFSLFATPPASLQLNATTPSEPCRAAGNGFNPAQVIEQVAYAIQTTYVSGQEMQLHLNPPDLGSLQVNVSVHDGVLSAQAGNPESHDAADPGRQSFATQGLVEPAGVAFDRIDVRLAGSQSGLEQIGELPTRLMAGSRTVDIPGTSLRPLYNPKATILSAAAPKRRGPASRLPLTSLDVMV